MKYRDWFGWRAYIGVTTVFALTNTATAQTTPTLRMRPAPTRLAQATPAQPTPAPAPPAAPAPDAAPPAAPSPDAAPSAPAPDAAPSPDSTPPAPAPAPAADSAQADVPVPVEATPPTEGEVIVVTGSRLGDPLGKQAPVLMLSHEDLERTGLTSVGDILQQLPVSGGAQNGKFNQAGNAGFPPDGSGVGAGATEADLRYLGSKRVLVLVDGVRWVNGSSGSGIAAAVDLNTIPISIVERIEVLEDGASPIYGSDAIAGVINIITRKQFSGALATAYTGGFSAGDGFTQKYDVAWGASTDKTSIVVGANFLDQRSVSSADRDTSKFPRPIGSCATGCSSTIPQGRISYLPPGVTSASDARNIVLNSGAGQPTTVGSNYHDYDPATEAFNFEPYNYVEVPSQRMGAFSSVTYKLLPEVNLRGKAAFTNRQSANQAGPEPIFIGPDGGNGNRLDTLTIDANNPYNPFGFSLVSGQNLFALTRRPVEAGPRHFDQNVNTFYVSGGADGHFDVGDRRFNWDATVAYGDNHADQRRTNAFNSLKLQEALGPGYLGSDGKYHCGISAAQPGDPNCVPFNIFGGQGPDGKGTITKEMLNYVTFTEHDVSDQTLVDAVANLNSNLVKLPAGWLAAAIGVEERRLTGYYEPDAIMAAGDGVDVPSSPESGKYSVTEGYAEVRAPILAGVPGAQLIDINGAARISKYSFLDAELTGKVGARWKPTNDMVLRGSYSRGFRAPSIGELFGAKARFDATLNDPCDGVGSSSPASLVQRCAALGVPVDGSYKQANPQISVNTGGNRALTPEKSDSINVSLAYSPAPLQNRTGIDSLDFEVAYWDIRLKDAIAAIDAQYQIDQCVTGMNQSFCDGIVRNAQGTISSFSNQLQNLNGINVRGLDFSVAYRAPRINGHRFRANWNSSVLLAYEEVSPTSTGSLTVDRVGTIAGSPDRAFPRLKSQLALGWAYGGFDLTLTTRYISALTEPCTGLQNLPGTCSDVDPVDPKNLSTNHLKVTVYNDLQLVWSPDFDHGLTVTAGVNNVLDRDPPPCYSCSLNGFNATTYDVPGVFGYLTAAYHVQ